MARLSRERVVAAAVALADARGIAAVSMRRVGQELGVEAMSLYHHVGGKDGLLDGMVDAVFAEIGPFDGPGWRAAMRRRADRTRATLARHPWATPLLESRRTPGPATLAHHDAVIGVLRGAGFPVPLAAHAFACLDSYTFGFAIQEAALPLGSGAETSALAREITGRFAAGEYPHLAELATEHVMAPGYSFGDEFAFGLDLLLDGLERALAQG